MAPPQKDGLVGKAPHKNDQNPEHREGGKPFKIEIRPNRRQGPHQEEKDQHEPKHGIPEQQNEAMMLEESRSSYGPESHTEKPYQN